MNGSKLHLGCGKCYLPGWVNVDVFDSTKADYYADIRALPFPNNTFELIYSSHVLEHVHRNMVSATLAHWASLLKPGGLLRLAVPNFRALCDYYLETGNLRDVMGLIYGGQNCHLNTHHVAFDRQTLDAHLVSAGLTHVREWDHTQTDHAAFDDYSQAYLPHMDRNGHLMSLNLEADKP